MYVLVSDLGEPDNATRYRIVGGGRGYLDLEDGAEESARGSDVVTSDVTVPTNRGL